MSGPLRVVLVYEGDISADEGVAHYVRTLALALDGSGHDVRVFTSGPRPDWRGPVFGAHGLSRNVRVPVNGNRVSVPWRVARGTLRAAIAGAPLDVLHIHVPHSPAMTGALLRHAAPTTAVVATYHMTASRAATTFATRAWTATNRRSLTRVGASIAVSGTAATFARRTFQVSAHVVPVMIESTRVASSTERASNVAFVGRLVPRKGATELIDAFARLPGRPTLVIAGESFGVVLLEAMAAGGCVVLAGRNPGYRGVLDDHPALLVDSRNVDALAGRLANLLEDHGLRERPRAWQQVRVRQFSVPVVLPELVGLYRDASARRLAQAAGWTA